MTVDIILFVTSAVASLFYVRSLKQTNIVINDEIDEFYDCSDDNELNIDINNDCSDRDLILVESLRNRTSLNANELICHVTSNNEVLPRGMLRSDMRLQNLWHRATYTLIIMINNKPTHEVEERTKMGDEIRKTDDPLSFNNTYVLLQLRSSMKDYCPLKLDPLPGGVVGYEESYQENVIRELQEEMGISVTTTTADTGEEILQRLFTFPYKDERVRVWGAFFTYTYYGTINDLILQKEEVDTVLCMSLAELKVHIEMTPNRFMPDACYAMHLYYQHRIDRYVKRRLLHGYSSSNLDAYTLRPKPKVIFFDCDDCLYFDSWKVANLLTRKIDEWCMHHGLPTGKAYELYKQYGTALRGLLAEGYIERNDQAIDQFLHDVHDIPIKDLIQPDPILRDILLQIDPSIPKYIFTASVREHAQRCIQALGIDDLFVDIIDCKSCQLETKHSYKAFHIAMEIAGLKKDNDTSMSTDDSTYHPELCLFFDDNIKNIEAARQVGWRSILVGTIGRDCRCPISTEHAENEIDRIHHIPHILPELF